MVNFAPLHVHTPKGSLLDGFCRIDPMIALAKQFGMDTIAITDHGTIFGHFEFYQKMKAAGLHPVLGVEAYVTPKKEWKKADFEKIHFTDITYRTKDELKQLAEDGYIEFKTKDLKDSFTKGKPTKPEHFAFLEQWIQKDLMNETLKKSTRFALSGKQDNRQQRLFEWSPRMGHLVMLAKNNEGYQNLLKLTTIGATEGMYYKPRVSYMDLKKYGKGIIATSACIAGTVAQLIRKGKLKAAKNQIKFYQSCFDEFYLEIQPNTMPEQVLVNQTLIQWSKELKVSIVATSDAHMLRPEDLPIHKAITNINRKNKEEDDTESNVYEHCIFYSAEEMLSLGMPKEALEMTYQIAHSCQVELDIGNVKYPEFTVPDEYDFDSYLAYLANKGLMERFYQGHFIGENFAQMYSTYKKRLDYELSIMAKRKNSAYMLIVYDFINYARSKGILVGPGRGSAAGSLVAYCLNITNLDPIKYNLLFERFLNPERKGYPDIDTDFDYLRRHEVLEYVSKKYGRDHVSQIITFGTLSTKSALKDIGRALGIDHNLINDMNKHVPSHEGKPMPISWCLEHIKIFEDYQKQYPRLFELALEVEGMPRSQSTHACGTLISPVPITDSIALVRGKKGELVACYDGPTLEEMGNLKFDFLGLKNLSVVEIGRQLAEKRHGVLIDVDNLEPDDEKTFGMIRRSQTDGVFQIESEGMKKMFRGMNQVDFETLIAGVALYRPGPMDYIPKYQSLANGYEELSSLHPKYDVITRNTFGIMIYQEQVMQIAQAMAGYTAGQADLLRKAVGKKKKEILEPALEELYKRMIEQGIPEQVAQKICDDIRPFAGYAFNRSHAAAYALLAYITAYLKCHYPLEYMTALLQVFYADKNKVVRYAKVAKDMGITVLPPDINRSEMGFTIDGENTIRYGFGAIDGLGVASVEMILQNRQTSFVSLEDVMQRMKLNIKSLTALTYSGAFDCFLNDIQDNRFKMMAHILALRGESPDEELSKCLIKFNERLLFEKEREKLGSYVSGHILHRYAEPTNWEELEDDVHFTTVSLVEAKVIKTKKGQEMAFLKVDTLEGTQDLTLFPNRYLEIKHALVPGMLLKVGIKGEMNWSRNEKSFIIQSITAPKKINKELWVKMEKEQEEEFMNG